MAVRIRLTRVGATKRPSYRVVAIEKQRSRDGRALEILGFYDPLTDPATVRLDEERIRSWIGRGAQPSDTVVKLMRQAGMSGPSSTETPAARKPAATKPAAKTAAKPAARAGRTTAPAKAKASSERGAKA